MCVAIILLVLGAIYLVKTGKLAGPPWLKHHHGSPEDSALRTLAERLANGDITPEQYRERVDVIRQYASRNQYASASQGASANRYASPAANPDDLR